MSNIKNKVKDFLGSVETVSVATCRDNKPHCRIMEIQKVEEDLKIWFVAHKSSPKIGQIGISHDACIVAFNQQTIRDIRLFGKLETHFDMERKKNVWKDSLDAYFKDGMNDPELTVIVFTPEKLEYRDMKSGGIAPEVEILQ